MKKAPVQLIAIMAVLLLAAQACESSEPAANNQPDADLQQESTNEGPEETQTVEILPITTDEEAIQDPVENQPEASADNGAVIGQYPASLKTPPRKLRR